MVTQGLLSVLRFWSSVGSHVDSVLSENLKFWNVSIAPLGEQQLWGDLNG
jgi:hypothetical protein